MQRDRDLLVQTSPEAGLAEPEPASRLGVDIARGALVVVGLTIVSRILGLVRTLVFSQTVGASCLGTAYVPRPPLLSPLSRAARCPRDIPVLARSAERAARDPAEKARVGQITSALLTWTVVIVVPLCLVIVAAAGPIASLLNPSNPNAHCAHADVILAVSIVVSAFPVLSAREGPEFDRTSAGSTRAVLLMSWLGTAVMAAIAVPAAHVLAKQPDQVPQLIEAFALFAPGIAGVAVIANLSRVMFVIGRLKVAAAATAGSWLVAIVACMVLVPLVPARLVVAALALGTTIGQTVVAIPLVSVTRKICGPAAVQGASHAALAGLAACAAGTAVGVAVSLAVPLHHKLLAAALAVLAADCAIIAFGVVAYILDNGDLKAVLAWVRGVVRAVFVMAGQIPADVFSSKPFNWLTLRLLPFQGGLGEYVEAGRTGTLMRAAVTSGRPQSLNP